MNQEIVSLHSNIFITTGFLIPTSVFFFNWTVESYHCAVSLISVNRNEIISSGLTGGHIHNMILEDGGREALLILLF